MFCDAGYTEKSLDAAWSAVRTCKKNGITVALPTSTVQMEFICHKKAPAMLEMARGLIAKAASYGCAVEFKAQDAARAERGFLAEIVSAAIDAGATIITLCDSTGSLLPGEFGDLVSEIASAHESKDVIFGAECSSAMSVSTACEFEALSRGATLANTTCFGETTSDLYSIANIIKVRGGELLGIACGINYPTLGRTVGEIKKITDTDKSELSPFDSGVRESEVSSFRISSTDNAEDVISAASRLGYELSDTDAEKVYNRVHALTEKKPIGKREFEAVIATTAMQIPATYNIKSYVINSGNIMTATAHVELEKLGEVISGISTGDGPIDAAFLSIEQIVGTHYELDDFQIRAITEGREALGEALVKIRKDGKLYSGRGVSTDIIGASIDAYVRALNKICYEENK